MKQITSLRELKQLASKETSNEEGEDFFISFGVARSSKHIYYDGNLWYIYNAIDDSEQTLTTRELKRDTNIIEAIEKGSLYLDE